MSGTFCRQVQEMLTAGGPTSLRGDGRAQQHLVDCEACYAFLEALGSVDAGLQSIRPINAPQKVINKTLEQVTGLQKSEQKDALSKVRRGLASRLFTWFRQRRLLVLATSSAMGATALLLFTVTVSQVMLAPGRQDRLKGQPTPMLAEESFDGKSDDKSDTQNQDAKNKESSGETIAPGRLDQSVAGGGEKATKRKPEEKVIEDRFAHLNEVTKLGREQSSGKLAADKEPSSTTRTIVGEMRLPYRPGVGSATGNPTSAVPPPQDTGVGNRRSVSAIAHKTQEASESLRGHASNMAFGDDVSGLEERDNEKPRARPSTSRAFDANSAAPKKRLTLGFVADGEERDTRLAKEEERRSRLGVQLETVAPAKKEAAEGLLDMGQPVGGTMRIAQQQAQQAHTEAYAFFAERRRSSGLTFRDATGYWENTYVPGDPDLRYLQMRLANKDLIPQNSELDSAKLHRASRQAAQPFDDPSHSALAVYLHSDQTSITQPTRMLVQVGIKGSQRHSGLRSAMNVGIVLDLRDQPDTGTSAAMRAVVEAFAQARQTGDQFSLTVAGRPGGLVVKANDFRFGPVKVALEQLLQQQGKQTTGETLDMAQALGLAQQTVSSNDDPNAPLGSSAIILVTAAANQPQLKQMLAIAHRSAVAGIPLSVVGVGPQVDLSQLDQLTLLGQGNRRLLTRAVQAQALVDRELSAVNRVVARAIRLRIRLAPGVKLVDVVGSRRLDEQRAERVRKAEQSIDQRMARNLGIEADRGQDEEGIQIVIPTYYAGDSHVVLLDVVAAEHGPIADVTMRYKDLVYLRNGVARANLSLFDLPARSSTLCSNVQKNYLSYQLSTALRQAAARLERGETDAALAELQRQQRLLRGVQLLKPELLKDYDLNRDLTMLAEYTAMLQNKTGAGPKAQRLLSDSLRLAGLLKILPPPELGDSVDKAP